jgi:hypothetical protein
MYRLHFTAEDLARTRIAAAPGPFTESVLAAERLRQRRPTLPFRAWRARLRGRLDRRTRVLANVFPATPTAWISACWSVRCPHSKKGSIACSARRWLICAASSSGTTNATI